MAKSRLVEVAGTRVCKRESSIKYLIRHYGYYVSHHDNTNGDKRRTAH
jgi:hypothetical protein